MPRKRKSSALAPRQRRTVAASDETGRVTYRELRNTPGRVWERLAGGGPRTLVADGEA